RLRPAARHLRHGRPPQRADVHAGARAGGRAAARPGRPRGRVAAAAAFHPGPTTPDPVRRPTMFQLRRSGHGLTALCAVASLAVLATPPPAAAQYVWTGAN